MYIFNKTIFIKDYQNYVELTGIFLYFWGLALDIYNEEVSDLMRVVFSASIVFSLVKGVYTVRVFGSLNFLVTMIGSVIREVTDFMIIFIIFLGFFAEINHILQVDVTSYGRTPRFFSHFLSMLRCSMGDFS